MNLVGDRRRRLHGVGLGARDEVARPDGDLIDRVVDANQRLVFRVEFFLIAHDPDHRAPGAAVAALHALAYGVFAGPEARGQVFVNNRHLRRALLVALVEVPPLSQRDAERAEVIGADESLVGDDQLLRVLRHVTVNLYRPPAERVRAERQQVAGGDRFDAGQRLHALAEP